MRAVLLAAVLLLTACGSSSAVALSTPSDSPAASSGTPGVTPTPAPSPSPQHGFAVACRLPITWFPADADPDTTNSGVGIFDSATGVITTTTPRPTPHFLTGGPSYDAVLGKWLPVPAGAVAPDGLHYAYAEWDPPASGLAGGVHVANGPVIGTRGRVHLVDAQSGADTVVYAGTPTFSVTGFVPEGILLSKFSATLGGSAASGLYLLKLDAGATPQLVLNSDYPLDGGGWRIIDGDTAGWGTKFSSGVSGLGAGNVLLRYDFSTLAVETWLTVPADHTILLLGVVDHDPIVLTVRSSTTDGQPTGAQVLRLHAANNSVPLFADDVFNDPLPGNLVGDSARVWFGGLGTLWLYSGQSMRHVSVLTQDALVDVGGLCLTA